MLYRSKKLCVADIGVYGTIKGGFYSSPMHE